VLRLIYDTQAASPEIKKVKSPSKVEKWKKGAAKWRGKKGNKRAKGSAGEIKALKSLTAKRIVPQSHTDTHTRIPERQKGQHHWHHMLRNLCYCHTNMHTCV